MPNIVDKNLLFVGHYPPPYGGVASHLCVLFPCLVAAGFKAISLTQTAATEKTKIQGKDIINIYYKNRMILYKHFLKSFKFFFMHLFLKKDLSFREYVYANLTAIKILETTKKYSIKIVFLYTITNGIAIPILKKHLPKQCKIALTIYGAFYLDPEFFLQRKMYMKQVFSDCDKILSSSQYCADSIKKILGYDFPVTVIYTGVDHNEFIPCAPNLTLLEKLNVPADAIVLLFLARMNILMGLDFLLETAETILSLNKDIYLILGGAKADLSSVAEAFAKNHDHVRYCCNIPSQEKIQYYSICHIFLAPTMQRHACMGVSIKEAMSAGKSVIASDSGGIPEAIDDGINGYTIPFIEGELDKNLFIERVRLLLSSQLRDEFSEKARQTVFDKFSNDQTTQSYLKVIDELDFIK